VTVRAALILLLLLAGRVAGAAEIKLGFVDIPFLIDEAPQAQAASSRLEREFAPRQEIIKDQKAELEVLRTELDSSSLDSAERAMKEREYRISRRTEYTKESGVQEGSCICTQCDCYFCQKQ